MVRTLKGQSLVWIMAVQAVVGYTWLVSGIDKVRSPTFLAALPDTLAEMAEETKFGWYRRFLEEVTLPNAELFGRLVTWGEVLVGGGMIVLAAALVVRGSADRWTLPISSFAGVALVAGIVMNANFHLAEGYSHPFLGYSDGLEGSVDLDSLMPVVQLVLLAFNGAVAWSARRRWLPDRPSTAASREAAPA